MPLSEEIKEKALALGYIKCGIIAAAGFPEYVRRLKKRMEQFPASEGFYNNLMPMAAPPEGARSIIVATKSYARYEIPEGIEGRIGKALLFDARIDWSDGARARAALVAFLGEKGVQAVRGSVPARMAADAAGVGFFGWNNFIYSDVGSYVWIETILVDTVLDYDEALTAAEVKRACGESCRKCVDACPTGALSAPFTMNGPMCAAPQIFSLQEPSEEMMEKLGVWQYGCDVCQDVCPMNQGKFGGDAVFPRLEEAVEYLSPEKLLAMDEDTYKNVILPRFWYSGENGRWKWRANALRAMVNSGAAQYHGLIKASLNDEDERVGRVARWGCAKLGIVKNRFTAKVELFEREKGWHYVSAPVELCRPLEHLADRGLIAVTATVGMTSWPTSLLPMGDGTHFIALPAKVRSKEHLTLGDTVEVSFEIRQRA